MAREAAELTNRLVKLVQPGRRAELGAPAQGFVKTRYFQGRGMADEYLAREIEAQAAMLQAPRGDAACKNRAFATARAARLGGAPTASVLLVGITG
jgi:hypothetical protein